MAQSKPATIYAVKCNGDWFICRLALGMDFSDEENPYLAVFSEASTTAYICATVDAECVINLDEESAQC